MKLLQLAAEIALLRLEMAWLWMQIWSLRAAHWLTTNPDEAAGAACGLLGAFLLATRTRWAPAGWWAFLASNVALLAFSWRVGLPGLFVLQVGFTCTSVLGIRNAAARSSGGM